MTFSSEQLKKTRNNILLTLVSIIVTLLIGEAGLQLFYRFSNKSWLWQYNNFHITFVQPVQDRRKYALRSNFSDTQIGVSTNDKGFRLSGAPSEITPETPVMVFLGDSKSFGAGVRDNQTYEYYIEQKLQKDGVPLHAVNAGVPSYNMRQTLDRYNLDVLPNYKPKVVVLQGTFNDISLLTYYRENWSPDKTWADIRFANFSAPLPGVQKIATVYYLNQVLKNSSPPIVGGSVEYEAYPDEEMLKAVRGQIEEFIKNCEAKSIPVVLVPIDPFYYQTANFDKNPSLPLWKNHTAYVEKWKEILLHYDDMLLDISNKHDSVYFFDVRKQFDATERGKLFSDFIHYSADGNELLADGLYQFMKEKGVLNAEAVK